MTGRQVKAGVGFGGGWGGLGGWGLYSRVENNDSSLLIVDLP